MIIDDLLNDVYSKEVCDLFTRGSHHTNISVILMTQNLFHKSRYCRDISLNAYYLVALDLTQDKNDALRFLTNIFATEYPPVIYSDIGDEACEIEL